MRLQVSLKFNFELIDVLDALNFLLNVQIYCIIVIHPYLQFNKHVK